MLNPPYLLFYPDRNNDDVPDGDPEVHLQGFGLEDTHSVVNSLRWGPDGWLYAAQGSTVTGHVTRPGLDAGKEPVHSMGQLIWRYHPETRRYEVFAEGGGNAFGVEIDAKGRIYSGHNGGDTRGFHYVQGGYYQKGFNKHGPLSNPYAFGYFPAMKHNRVPRFTHTFVIYEADALPERYRGLLFGVAPLLNHVVMSEVRPDGSSFQTQDVGLAVSIDDPWFRPVDIKLGPDGALYIADWYDRQVNHYRNHEGQIDPGNGRIYRLKARECRLCRTKPVDLSRLSTPELVKRLADPNKWTRQTALRLIGDRKDASIAPELKQLVAQETGQLALEALWALNLVGGLDEATALKTLEHADPYVRLWTARLLCDRSQVSPSVAAALARRAAIEPDVEVRSQLACSAKRLPARDALPIVRALAGAERGCRTTSTCRSCSGGPSKRRSRPIPRRCWRSSRTARSGTCRSCGRPIAERLMRRFAAAGTQAGPDRLRAAAGAGTGPGPRQAADGGVRGGLRRPVAGRAAAGAGRGPGQVQRTVGHARPASGQARGDLRSPARAGRRAGRSGQAAPAPPDPGRGAPAGVRSGRAPARLPVVRQRPAVGRPDRPGRLRRPGHRRRGASRPMPTCPTTCWPPPRACSRLAAPGRPSSSRRSRPGRSIPRPSPARSSRSCCCWATRESPIVATKLFGPIKPATSAELHAQIDRLAASIRAGSGVPKPGKQIFDQQCARCHTLFGKGGKVGPDLTTYRRDDLETMLLNIVNPSAEIREGYATLDRRHDRRPRALRRRGRAGQERRGLARQRRQGR